MLELILIVNLAFSICGFVFILRMWKEVKTRRDMYGENWGIPRGQDVTAQQAQPVYSGGAVPLAYAQPQAPQQQAQQVEQVKSEIMDEGDINRLVAAVMAAQAQQQQVGGVNAK